MEENDPDTEFTINTDTDTGDDADGDGTIDPDDPSLPPNDGGDPSSVDPNSPLSDNFFRNDVVAERGLLIALFVCMWALLMFPILYDVIVTTVHLVVTFTPKPNDRSMQEAYATLHYEYYMNNKYDPYAA